MRWLAPVGVMGVAALAATGAFKAGATSESLPQTTPAALIAAVQTSEVDGFSGTVVSRFALGLPELPSIGGTSEGSTTLPSLLAGSHTLQIWYGGPERQRVALLGETDETDVFHNGRDLWQWSSADRVARHAVLPARTARPAATPVPSAPAASLTPVEVGRSALAALDPTTRVVMKPNRTVADRSAYELILTPRTDATKIGSVHIAIDGHTKVPLAVQIYARGASAPAVDIAFTTIRFGRQASRNFVFSPPPGAAVRKFGPAKPTTAPPVRATPPPVHGSVTPRKVVARTGSGWSTVIGLRPGSAAVANLTSGPVLKALQPVSGAWGKGRLLDAALLSVLITDDGRVFAGAVPPSALYAAAAK